MKHIDNKIKWDRADQLHEGDEWRIVGHVLGINFFYMFSSKGVVYLYNRMTTQTIVLPGKPEEVVRHMDMAQNVFHIENEFSVVPFN